MAMFDLRRQLAAEALGTAFLVAAVVGSGIMAERLTHDVALQLLCNTLPTGAALVVLISIFGPISGAHFNPAVSFVFAARGKLARSEAVSYIAAQLAGGIAGTMIAHLMFGMPVLELSTKLRTGGGQWIAEAVATFGLVATILGGLRFQKPAIPWLVGLYITAAYWFTASTSFANPAVTVARALTNSFSGIAPLSVPLFIGAQLAGALLAGWLGGWLFASPETAQEIAGARTAVPAE
jgi:glycerol uptake facilitator-like aquaporin